MMTRIISLIFLLSISNAIWAAPVNINNASAEQIANALVGVGLSKAAAIIKYRTENGPFKTVNELTEVKGIGQKTIDKNRVDIIIESIDDMNS